MLLDPITFLVVRSRAKAKNLSNSDALKATLLGSVIGGGSATTGLLFADRSIKQKAQNLRAAVSEPKDPSSCMDKLIGSLNDLVDCDGTEKIDEKELAEARKAFSAIVKKLSINAEEKQLIENKIGAVASVKDKSL